MLKSLLPRGLVLLLGFAVSPIDMGTANAQHLHTVPHTTTHYDRVQHGLHSHWVPHTTTHFDSYVHYGPDYVPHTTTHYDAVRHRGHIDYVPHTSTHYDAVYPSNSLSPTVYANPTPVPAMLVSPAVTYSSGVTTVAPPNMSPPVTVLATSAATLATGAPIVANKIPLRDAPVKELSSREVASRFIQLSNPKGTDGEISYTVNTFGYTIKPGEIQKLPLDRDWVLKFDNGLGKPVVYRLTEGRYEFKVSGESGWDVAKSPNRDELPPAPPAPESEELETVDRTPVKF